MRNLAHIGGGLCLAVHCYRLIMIMKSSRRLLRPYVYVPGCGKAHFVHLAPVLRTILMKYIYMAKSDIFVLIVKINTKYITTKWSSTPLPIIFRNTPVKWCQYGHELKGAFKKTYWRNSTVFKDDTTGKVTNTIKERKRESDIVDFYNECQVTVQIYTLNRPKSITVL